MRSVSFVQRLELNVPGNLFTNAFVLGDVDNDKENEFVVGTVNGLLCVFKGMNTQPWKVASGLGMVTCVGVGNICNKNKNYLLCLTAEGWCHIFNIKDTKGQSDLDNSKQDDKVLDSGHDLKANHIQHIPSNTKTLLIYDVDGDGQCELIVGHTDRTVRAYRWVEQTPTETDSSGFALGYLEYLQQWYLPGQVGSLAVCLKGNGDPMLVVSQPGCNYVELVCNWVKNKEQMSEQSAEHHVIFHPISTTRARNPNVSTEIVGNISRGNSKGGQPDLYALCTLDGTLMLVADDRIQWSHLVDHQLFALSKLDITGDGKEEVIACAWDGQTYIVDQKKQTVRFHFEQNVCGFCAGHYGVGGYNSPSLVYATFNNQIYLYWNVKLSDIPSSSLLDVMATDDTLQERLRNLDMDTSNPCELRDLYKWCIYGKSPSS